MPRRVQSGPALPRRIQPELKQVRRAFTSEKMRDLIFYSDNVKLLRLASPPGVKLGGSLVVNRWDDWGKTQRAHLGPRRELYLETVHEFPSLGSRARPISEWFRVVSADGGKQLQLSSAKAE